MPQNISLDGLWDFYYTPQAFTADETAVLPDVNLFSGKMIIPGYWDDHYELFDTEDFFGTTARFNPDYRKVHFPMGRTLTPHASSSFMIGTGFYRTTFKLNHKPNQQFVLTIGPAVKECFVYCNRQYVGKSQGYSTASTYDLSQVIKHNGDNELIIALCNYYDDGGAYHRLDGSHNGEAFGCRPGQHRGLALQGYQSERAGIGAGISLKITDKARIVDWFVSYENKIPHWQVTCKNSSNCSLHYVVKDKNKILDSGTIACTSEKVDFISAAVFENWSDSSPKLYELSLELIDSEGKRLDFESRKWGARTIKVDNLRILVNGLPVFFRGVTEHCYFPLSCNAHFDKEQYLEDLGVLKQAGFNYIRCHTWCPPEEFYDACDELGLYVQTEAPSVYTFEEVEEIFKLIRKHPCAVIFCEGNEKYIDEDGIKRLEKVASLLKKKAPGVLFCPQEAIRGVEYGFTPDQLITEKPFPHDAKRFKRIAEFSDLYGSLSGSIFSYAHDMFPGVDASEYLHSLYKKPCLCHEIGILGGYLDFNLESRYEETFIGTDLFRAARKQMQKNGVYHKAHKYFQLNTRFISILRKQLLENLRSCPSISGYDYLGGIDTHWHFTGYPCGIFNEFYEEKPGESIADVYRYNSESMLLISALNKRNYLAGTEFTTTVKCSYFGKTAPIESELLWSFEIENGEIIAGGKFPFKISECGTVTEIGEIAFELPHFDNAQTGVLRVCAPLDKKIYENHWNIWVFPKVDEHNFCEDKLRFSDRLSHEDLDFIANGATLVLTDNFPGEMLTEQFRTHTSGRVFGHAGFILNRHPLLKNFPHKGYADWQLFPMINESKSLVYDSEMPEFQPILELIPSFKLVRHKALLSEFAVGKGRLIICGLRLDANDCAAEWMKQIICQYAMQEKLMPEIEWPLEHLRKRVNTLIEARKETAVDAGGRPIQ